MPCFAIGEAARGLRNANNWAQVRPAGFSGSKARLEGGKAPLDGSHNWQAAKQHRLVIPQGTWDFKFSQAPSRLAEPLPRKALGGNGLMALLPSCARG